MKDERSGRRPKKHERPVNKANMDQPQEEFVSDEATPSHSDPANDRDHGAEVAMLHRDSEN